MSEMLKELPPEAEKVWEACFPMPMDTAKDLRQSTEQLGRYLAQMGQMIMTMQRRMDEIEKNQKCNTIYHDEVLQVRFRIQKRAMEYGEQYQLTDKKDQQAIRAAIKKDVLKRQGIKDMHDCPKIALEAVVNQIDRWSDIRTVMKLRDRHRESGG